MTRGTRRWLAAYGVVIAAFLAAVARYYHPGLGVTALIGFPAATHKDELAVVQQTPHFDDPLTASGYDGQNYAQLAIDPLIRNPATDRSMDDPPYRARRILFSWTAYILGLGKPAWILHVYAAQNIVVWLLLAALLCRWLPPVSFRNFVLWSGCLLSHGLLMSVRFALPDAGSALLIAAAVAAAERGQLVLPSIVIGAAGLARETNLLAASLFAADLRRDRRSWLILAGCLLLCVLPIAIWLDYLRSIYRGLTLAGGENIVMPFAAVIWKCRTTIAALANPDQRVDTIVTLCAVAGFLVQGGYTLATLARREGRVRWAFVGASFLVLGLSAHQVVWMGVPGAFTRVVLPLTIGTNVLLARPSRAPWTTIGLANLGVVPGVLLWWWG